MNRSRRPRIPDQEWENHKGTIKRLFIDEDKAIIGEDGLIEIMRHEYSFDASKSQYETRLKKWGFRKNASRELWFSICNTVDTRRLQGKESQVYLHEELIEDQKIEKERRRYQIPPAVDELFQAMPNSLPQGVRFTTPTLETTLAIRQSPSASLLSLHSERAYARPQDNYGHALESFEFSELDFIGTVQSGEETNFGIDMALSSGNISIFPDVMTPNATLGYSWMNQLPTFNAMTLDNDFADPFFNIRGYSLSSIGVSSLVQQRNYRTTELLLDFLETRMPPTVLNYVRHLGGSSTPAYFSLEILNSPDTNALLETRSPHLRTIYTALYALCNDMVRLERLSDPQDPFDYLIISVISHFNHLSTRRLCFVLDSIPETHFQAFQRGLFCAAIEVKAQNLTKTLLDRGVDPNMKIIICYLQFTPLKRAFCHDCLEITQALVRQGANLNTASRFGRLSDEHLVSWLHRPKRAITTLTIEIFKFWLKSGMKLDILDRRIYGSTDPRIHAAIAESVAEHDFDVSSITGFLDFALEDCTHDVATQLVVAALKATQDEDTDIESHTEKLQDFLAISICKGHIKASHEMLRFGIKPTQLCLVLALQSPDTLLAREFIQNGMCLFSEIPDSSIPDYHAFNHLHRSSCDRSPIANAIRSNSSDILSHILEKGLLERLGELKSSKQVTGDCILAACETGNEAILEKLLCLYPRIALQDSDYYTVDDRPLVSAIETGHDNLVSKLLERDILPDAPTLCAAIENRRLDLLSLLIDCIGNNTSIETGDKSPLHPAVLTGNAHLVRALISVGYPTASIWETSNYGSFPTTDNFADLESNAALPLMTTAILSGHQVMVDLLLEQKLPNRFMSPQDSNDQPPHHHHVLITPITAAVRTRNYTVIKQLMAIGVSPCDSIALEEAVKRGDIQFTEFLLDETASQHPLAVGYGQRALTMAVTREDIHMVELLLRHAGAKQERTITAVGNAFLEAIGLQAFTIMDLFLGSGVDVNMTAFKIIKEYIFQPVGITRQPYFEYTRKRTPLLQAITMGDLVKVCMLVDKGARINEPASLGLEETPLQSAVEHGALDIINYLLERGAHPNEAPAARGGHTALQLAAIKGHIGIAALLIERGANVNAPAAILLGRTAFEGAAEFGRIDMLMFLADHGLDIVSDGGKQYDRAVLFAKTNGHTAVVNLVGRLYVEARQAQGIATMASLDGVGHY